ncbi:MAG: biotin--[Clostridia bacterium]|nr:biotin--[acetyl-CoA-carboxylase] ligase [Clostridia bacterium]
MLTVDNIRANLCAKYKALPIVVYDTIDSTNTQAKLSSIDQGIFVAKHQTAGRGRQGKSFYSPDSTGLYMSVVLPITPMEAYEFTLTAAAAVAAARAIENVCNISVQIKWVNDLYLHGKKVAGILTEADIDRVIVGIGINISTESFPADIPLAGSLDAENISKSKLAASFAENLFDITSSKSREFMSEYRSRSMLLGKEISFEKDGNAFTANALRIEDNGELTVLSNGIELTLHSGEVQIIL